MSSQMAFCGLYVGILTSSLMLKEGLQYRCIQTEQTVRELLPSLLTSLIIFTTICNNFPKKKKINTSTLCGLDLVV